MKAEDDIIERSKTYPLADWAEELRVDQVKDIMRFWIGFMHPCFQELRNNHKNKVYWKHIRYALVELGAFAYIGSQKREIKTALFFYPSYCDIYMPFRLGEIRKEVLILLRRGTKEGLSTHLQCVSGDICDMIDWIDRNELS